MNGSQFSQMVCVWCDASICNDIYIRARAVSAVTSTVAPEVQEIQRPAVTFCFNMQMITFQEYLSTFLHWLGLLLE